MTIENMRLAVLIDGDNAPRDCLKGIMEEIAIYILYTGKTDGYVLVSSDSDFTPLAIRLRESGMYVIGIGEEKTPKAFVQACDKFIRVEVIRDKYKKTAKAAAKAK